MIRRSARSCCRYRMPGATIHLRYGRRCGFPLLPQRCWKTAISMPWRWPRTAMKRCSCSVERAPGSTSTVPSRNAIPQSTKARLGPQCHTPLPSCAAGWGSCRDESRGPGNYGGVGLTPMTSTPASATTTAPITPRWHARWPQPGRALAPPCCSTSIPCRRSDRTNQDWSSGIGLGVVPVPASSRQSRPRRTDTVLKPR